jgi:hypothetical protein
VVCVFQITQNKEIFSWSAIYVLVWENFFYHIIA